MRVHFERVNNRYRGPFEKEKMTFLINEISSMLGQLYSECNDQKQSITNLININENEGFGSADTSNNISSKEDVRDLIMSINSDALNMLEELDNNI